MDRELGQWLSEGVASCDLNKLKLPTHLFTLGHSELEGLSNLGSHKLFDFCFLTGI